MRWLAVLGAAAAAACASIAAPPGGPPRTTPPEILSVSPESGAVNVRPRDVVFQFDAVVNDRSSGSGGGGLRNLFLISPREGAPRVEWKRSRIEVRPRRGFRPNTAYSVTLLPGLSDLRSNVMRTGRTIVFSTGPTIPPYFVRGRVFDWINEQVARNALVEVLRLRDSVTFIGIADSTGQFAVGPLVEDTYVVRAIMDNNNNRALDPNEPWDSMALTISGMAPFLELLAAPRDTIGPRLLSVTAADTLTLSVGFDRPLDPTAPLAPSSFLIVSRDSTELRIASVRTKTQEDSAQRVRADSAQHEAARQDTTPRARPLPALPAPAAELKPSRPAPPKDVTIRLDSLNPLRPGGTYRITATNMRGLLGRSRSSDRVFTLPVARPDSVAGAPPPRRPPP